MVSKCSNPDCSIPFLYLHSGKLFRFDTPNGPQDQDSPRSLKRIEFFWLCDACVREFTIVQEPAVGGDNAVDGAVILPRVKPFVLLGSVVEYLHLDLGSINGGIFGSFFPSIQVNTTRFTDEILRVGFNYKFDEDRPGTNAAMNAFAALPRAPAAPPAVFLGWTGWYVGVNAGYIDSVGRTNTDAPFSVTDSRGTGDAGNLANTATNQFNNRPDGFLGGVQAGYNFQFSPSLVAGWEADIQGSTLRENLGATATASGGAFRPAWVTTTTVSNHLDYLGTVRARIGVTPTPDVLFYSTGGLAFGGVRSSTQINFNNTDAVAVPGSTSGSLSETRFGWTAGGGAEWMFSSNWTAKLEYLYYNLGAAKYSTGGYAVDLTPTGFAGFGIVSLATSTTPRFEGNIVRVGVNYRFGG